MPLLSIQIELSHGIIPLYRINAETYFALFCKVRVKWPITIREAFEARSDICKKGLEAFIPYILHQVGLYNGVEHA